MITLNRKKIISSSLTSLFICLATITFSSSPVKAQIDIEQVLSNTPSYNLRFSPNTVGSVIAGFDNRVYILNAQEGQYLRLKVHSTGARAAVTIFDSYGRELKTLTAFTEEEEFIYELPESGNYYILCYGGPTYHYYDFTIRVD